MQSTVAGASMGPELGVEGGGGKGEGGGPIICCRRCLKVGGGGSAVGVGESGFKLVKVGGAVPVEGRVKKNTQKTKI